MHPRLKSPKQLLLVGLLASPICFWVLFVTVSAVNVPWGRAALWLIPPMFIIIYACLSTWYFCRITIHYRWKWLRIVWAQTIAALILTAIWLLIIFLYANILDLLIDKHIHINYFIDALPILFAVSISLYFVAVLTHYLILVIERNQIAEEEVLKQKLMKGEAQLRALKATVHPHFLFNSLNLLSPLMRSAPDKAQQVVAQLSDFLLYSLQYSNKDQVTLKDEIQHIQDYLEIEKVRLGNRLQLDIRIDENQLEVPILPLVLLPLIENAIKHGISQCLEGGTLTLSIQRDRDNIAIDIANPYDRPTRPLKGSGLGLETLKQRLANHYGPRAQMSVAKQDNHFQVHLQLPVTRDKRK